MALTQISTAGVKDDAVTAGKIPANAVGSSELADNAVDTNAIQDQAVALSKLPHGDGSSNGKFLRANNGADPTFETVSTDLVGDTSPQLGGNLDVNGANVVFGDSSNAGTNLNRLKFGASTDLQIYHNTNTNNVIDNAGSLTIQKTDGEKYIHCSSNSSVDLYHNGGKRIETTDNGALVQTTGDAFLTILADSDNNNNNNWPLIDFRINNLSGTTEARIAYREDNSVLKFDIAGSEKVGINANGLVFNGDTAAANALDDYEEGTYSVTMTGESGGSATVANNYGAYTKIGRLVTVNMNVSISNKSSLSGVILISLPFTVADTIASTSLESNGIIGYFANLATASSHLGLSAVSGGTNCQIRGVESKQVTTATTFDANDITNSFEFRGTISYFV